MPVSKKRLEAEKAMYQRDIACVCNVEPTFAHEKAGFTRRLQAAPSFAASFGCSVWCGICDGRQLQMVRRRLLW